MLKKVLPFSLIAVTPVFTSHLDDIDGLFTNFKYDQVKFKTQTNCSLDKYPEVTFIN